jgi:predicted ferric reductase
MTMNRTLLVAGAIVAITAGGIGLRIDAGGTLPWMVSRASGLVAFALLSFSVIFGLLMSTKIARSWLSGPFAFAVHQFVSVLTLVFLGAHGGSLLFDGFLHFGAAEVLVPLASPYRPFWVGLGVVSAWLTAAVTASFWARKRIGVRNWRRLHYASFFAYVLGLLHGITSGTDSGTLIGLVLYTSSVSAVGGLLVYRMSARVGTRAARPRASTPPAVIAQPWRGPAAPGR